MMLRALRRRRGLATRQLAASAHPQQITGPPEDSLDHGGIGQARAVSGPSRGPEPLVDGELLSLLWRKTLSDATATAGAAERPQPHGARPAAGSRWGPQPWQWSRKADEKRAEAWRKDPRRIELLEQLKAMQLSGQHQQEEETEAQEVRRDREHRRRLKQAAEGGEAEAVLGIARSEHGVRPEVAAEALAACIRHMDDPVTAQGVAQTAAQEGLLPPKSAAKAIANILDKLLRTGCPRQVILAASKLLGRDPNCVESGQAQPSNHSLRIVTIACGHLGDRDLVNTLWADLSTCLVNSAMPSDGAYAGLLHAAVTYDRLCAQLASTSQVAAVLAPHSFTSEVLERVRAVPYISFARIQTDQMVSLLGTCSNAGEIDQLLFSPHATGVLDVDRGHVGHEWLPEPIDDREVSDWGRPSLETGWLPPPLSSPVACAAIDAFVRMGHPGPAWHVLWKCHHTLPHCPEVWEAIASSCARVGDVLGASRSIQSACTHGVILSQDTLLRVLRCIANSEPVPGQPHPYQEARTLWRSGYIRRNPHADRLWIQCMAESGYDSGHLILWNLRLYAERVQRESDPMKRQLNLERLAAAGAAACLRLRKTPWHLRLQRLEQCLEVLKGGFPPECLSQALSRAAVQAVLEAAPTLGVVEREGKLTLTDALSPPKGALPAILSMLLRSSAVLPRWTELFKGLLQVLATAGISLGEETCRCLESFLAECLQGTSPAKELRQQALRGALREMEELTVLVQGTDLALDEALRSLGVASAPQ